ncbi:hypothetical protein KM043_010911 [Ampulex compressa]|nr:hypothetical protein KM043_010911 [Ampulex compressa]
MNHPATRDPFGSRSPGCCYHSWNPQLYPPCRVCQRPVLTLQQCSLRRPAPFVHPSFQEQGRRQEAHRCQELLQECRQQEQQPPQERPPRRQRSLETPSPRRHVDIVDRRPASNPHYHTHPPPSSSSGHHLSKSVSAARLGSPGGSLGQRSPGARVAKPPGLDPPHRWIGEETKRALPSHVYKYYLAHTKEYRRQNFKVRLSFLSSGPGRWKYCATGLHRGA